jgi:hypothetical protein
MSKQGRFHGNEHDPQWVARTYPQERGSLFVAFYDSKDYGVLTRLQKVTFQTQRFIIFRLQFKQMRALFVQAVVFLIINRVVW